MILDKRRKNNIKFLGGIFIIVFSLAFLSVSTVKALGIEIVNPTGNKQTEKTNADIEAAKTQAQADQEKDRTLAKTAAKALNSAIQNVLSTLAFDTATWLGSGNTGQKPMFITEGWGAYLSNVADTAAGTFLEQLGKNNGYVKFNLCEPSLNVKIAIGLGLIQNQKPKAPACTWTTMTKNWKTEADRIRAMGAKDFLKNMQSMFEPASNDVGAALTLQTGIMEAQQRDVVVKDKERTVSNGWLDVRNIAGNQTSPPDQAKRQAQAATDLYNLNLGKYTGDALVDAANVFLNQLAISAFNSLMQKMAAGAGTYTTPYSGDYGGLANYQADVSIGQSDIANKALSILEPNFSVRADYSILSDLVQCPDPTKAGPDNCVITDRFSQAVAGKTTVGEAMKSGYLNKDGSFGFDKDGNEPKYTDESYPYRSMVILRKYRIIPVGWELAAQHIKFMSPMAKTYTLGDMVACFDPNDEYAGLDEAWCHGLVDPNWVLKAPLNYCRRQGYGPELTSNEVTGEGSDSSVSITRNNNYCGDQQSCIRENNDGSCGAYGYCVQDRRKWSFNTKSCDAKYNTCQTFKGEAGNTVSYLENTLDYGGCSVSNAGCKAYATAYNYATQAWQANGAKMYMDSGAEKCDSKNEGCHEFIRTADGIGANLIANSSFENSLTGTFGAGIGVQVANAYDGLEGLQLSGNVSKGVTAGLADYAVGGESFTLSFYAKNCGTTGTFGINNVTTALSTSPDSWSRQIFNYVYPANTSGNNVLININPPVASCVIDAIKLENGSQATAYSDYRTDGLVYEKLLPDYLASANICYDANGNSQPNAPAECNKYVRKCTVNEVGCSLYTGSKDGISVPAKASAQDHCPAECVGYDTYVQGDTFFDSQRSAYFIPSTAKTCGAESVGCEEFTNLDKVANGGEGREYYSYLKQCIKPDAASCAAFYTWEGSDETGYQLKVVSLKHDASGRPAVTSNDSSLCSAAIYALPSTDPSHNPDCRQFYDQSGNISYHLMSYTIACSDNCLSYRMTRVNTDASGNVVCKNGGVFDAQHNGCIYMGIPGEGQACSAENNGCREYSGNSGNNMKIVVNNDFEGSTQGWTAGGGSTVGLSNNALLVGGRSMSVSGGNHSASVALGSSVEQNKSYVLNFIAEGSGSITAVIANGAASSTNFAGSAVLSATEWKKFTLNMPSLTSQVLSTEVLTIAGTGNLNIDDVRLTEIIDRYYLIGNSWITPVSCDEDINGNPSPLFALGCDAYSNSNQETDYLHSFSHLCQESAVGCELMIDTKNSDNYGAQTASGVSPSVTTPADSYIYAVYDEKKQCSAIDKGCQRLGMPYNYNGATIYTDAYLKNDPEKYSDSLCDASAVDCGSWTMDSGDIYFKDPGDQACEYRQAASSTNGWGWYKKKVKRCISGPIGNVCLVDKNCAPLGATTTPAGACKTETTDTACPVNNLKTFGTGGANIDQPAVNNGVYWAGICPASESSCTEYIDPMSKFSTNLVVSKPGPVAVLEPNTLYIISGVGGVSNCVDVKTGVPYLRLYSLSSSNALSGAQPSVSSVGLSARFYVGNNINNIRCAVSGTAEVKQAAVDYQLSSGIDTKTCNGIVDFEKGCVLFDERTQNGGSGLINLSSYYDAFLTVNDGNGVSPISNSNTAYNNSNKIIKVSPDRICGQWLACQQTQYDVSTQAAVCQQIGVCNKFDDNGDCDRFVANGAPVNQTFPTNVNTSFISDMTGYVKVGDAVLNTSPNGSNNRISIYPNDYYQFAAASSSGLMSNVYNGSFEDTKNIASSSSPSRWLVPNNGWECSNTNNCYVINNPVEIQFEKVCIEEQEAGDCSKYAPDGRNILKMTAPYGNVGSIYTQAGYEINVQGGQSYALSAYINTSKLSDGKVVVKVQEYTIASSTATGTPIFSAPTDTNNANGHTINGGNVIEAIKGKPWALYLSQFTVQTATKAIRLTLTVETDLTTSPSSPQGDYYFDDISMRPTLNSRDGWVTPQSCRIYPKEDSLSCDYYESSGIRRKGWYGYCLEYDRAPGLTDACLLWWPIPNNTYKSKAACGDGYANGTEDCDCPQPGGLFTNDTCNANDISPAYPYNPYGTTNYNQYKCTKCLWMDGWCGDNIIQANYHEHCDWNESGGNPNITNNGVQQTCWSDHSGLPENAANDFAHNGYNDYLYGSIGCYNNSYLAQKCTFNPTGCSDNMVNNQHTRAQCIAAGGVVVDDTGTAVTDATGRISVRGVSKVGSGDGITFFCKLPLSSCAAIGWTQYGNWSTTAGNTCSDNSCSPTYCDNPAQAWSPVAKGACSYAHYGPACGWQGCPWTCHYVCNCQYLSQQSCAPTITQIGCY